MCSVQRASGQHKGKGLKVLRVLFYDSGFKSVGRSAEKEAEELSENSNKVNNLAERVNSERLKKWLKNKS